MNDTDPRSGFAFYVKSPSGIETALHVATADVASIPALVEGMKEADALLKAAGFVRSDRLDKPAYQKGGGAFNAPQETPPPADLEVPEHCGQPMKYVPEKPKANGDGVVSAHWDCRKGRGCAEPRTVGDRVYGFTNWDLAKKAAATNGTKPQADDGALASPAQVEGMQKNYGRLSPADKDRVGKGLRQRYAHIDGADGALAWEKLTSVESQAVMRMMNTVAAGTVAA